MAFQSQTILTAGTKLVMQKAIGDRTLPTITVTTSAAVVTGALTIPITALVAPVGLGRAAGKILIQQGDKLTFNSTTPETVTIAEDVIVGATSIVLATPTVNAIQSGNTATSAGLLQILGADSSDFKLADKTVSVRSFSDGLWDSNRKVQLSASASISGIYKVGDPCFSELILPAATDTFEVFFKLIYPDGDFRSGYAFLKDYTEPLKLDDIRKYSFTLMLNGQVTFGNVNP